MQGRWKDEDRRSGPRQCVDHGGVDQGSVIQGGDQASVEEGGGDQEDRGQSHGDGQGQGIGDQVSKLCCAQLCQLLLSNFPRFQDPGPQRASHTPSFPCSADITTDQTGAICE